MGSRASTPGLAVRELAAVRRKQREAFTLIELLVVIAVIGILAALLMPVIGTSLRQAEISSCRSQLRQTGGAIVTYAKDHRLFLPPALSWPACRIPQYAARDRSIDAWPGRIGNLIHGLWPRYLGDRDVFLCPATDMAWDNKGFPPVWPPGYTRWQTGQGSYIYTASFPDNLVGGGRGWYKEVPRRPRKLTDGSGLPTMMDYSCVDTATEQPRKDEHFSNHMSGKRSLWGLNILYLDGSAAWKHCADAQPRFEWRCNDISISFVY